MDQAEFSSPSTSHIEVVPTNIPVDSSNKTSQLILEAIRENGGRIPYSKFMAISLYNPVDGYYSTGKVEITNYNDKKKAYDFYTAPESSEVFGASLGQAAEKVWETMGRPEHFDIIEMGAGTGALAKSLLQYAREMNPQFYTALKYTILEYGELIKQQQTRAAEFNEKPGEKKVRWVQGSASNLPFSGVKGVFISNELPDTFPIEIVKKVNGTIKQKYITIEDNQWKELWVNPTQEVQDYIEKYIPDLEENLEEPVNLPAVRMQKQLDQALEQGAIITIDYGKQGKVNTTGEFGEKPEAIRVYGRDRTAAAITDTKRQYRLIGNIDITASVNFAILEQIAREDGLQVALSSIQKEFLPQVGAKEVFQHMINKMRTTTSWKELLDISKKLKDSAILFGLGDMGNYYAHMLTKGINLDFPTQEDISKYKRPQEYRPKLKVGQPHQEVIFDLPHAYLADPIVTHLDQNGCFDFDEVREIDPSGVRYTIDIMIRKHRGIKIYSSDGKLILDTNNRKQLKKYVEASGYTFDTQPPNVLNAPTRFQEVPADNLLAENSSLVGILNGKRISDVHKSDTAELQEAGINWDQAVNLLKLIRVACMYREESMYKAIAESDAEMLHGRDLFDLTTEEREAVIAKRQEIINYMENLPGFEAVTAAETGTHEQYTQQDNPIKNAGPIELPNNSPLDTLAYTAAERKLSYTSLDGSVHTSVINRQTLYMAEAFHLLEKGNAYQMTGDDLLALLEVFDVNEYYKELGDWLRSKGVHF